MSGQESLPRTLDPRFTPERGVFRIFGNGARTILTEADWLEIPEANRQAILEEAALWVYEDGVFRGDGQWRRANVTEKKRLAGSLKDARWQRASPRSLKQSGGLL